MNPIFEFTTENVSSTLAYVSNVILGVMPLIVVILGIGIALWIIGHFISLKQ